MLQAYTGLSSVASGAPIVFQTASIDKGCNETLRGSVIDLNTKGIYLVHVDISAIASTAGNIDISAYVDNAKQPQAFATETASDTSSVHNLNFDTLVQVQCNNSDCCCAKPTVVSIVNGGVAITTVQANVVVYKIC